MNERIKELRKALNMSGEAFGQVIGVGRATISQIESEKISLTDRNINAICEKFHVNEEWLREGKGDMFVQLSKDEELAAFFGEVQFLSGENFKKRFITALAGLEPEEWEVLEKMAKRLYEEQERDG